MPGNWDGLVHEAADRAGDGGGRRRATGHSVYCVFFSLFFVYFNRRIAKLGLHFATKRAGQEG